MITGKPLQLGLFVIGGWAIAPKAWANPPETSAETVFQSLGTPVTQQPSSERPPATTVKDWMAQIASNCKFKILAS